jgi:hypothetical protein
MRNTLLTRPALRTPACPGFGISGDRKRECFGRSCVRGAVSSKSGLRALPHRWDPVVVVEAHRRRTRDRAFERVQMHRANLRIGLKVLGETSAPPLFKRVQMERPPKARESRPSCLGSFEHVQMYRTTLRIGLGVLGGTSAPSLFERVQMKAEFDAGISHQGRMAMPPLQ